MGQGDSMNTLYTDYEDVGAVIDVLAKGRPSDSDNSSGAEDDGTGGHPITDDWDLSLGWDGAFACYTGGWAEGAQRAYDLADKLTPKPKGLRTTLNRSVAGA